MHLVGPADGHDETLEEKPHQRYLTGILYPIPLDADSSDTMRVDVDEDLVDEASGQLVDENGEDPITLSGQNRPSSVGISFVTSDWAPVEVEVEFGRYDSVPDLVGEEEWVRQQINLSGSEALLLTPGSRGSASASVVSVLSGSASVEARWRPHKDGAIVTVVLVNRRRLQPKQAVRAADCLFQVSLRCRPSEGLFSPYPRRPHITGNEESEELELLYHNVRVFAVGHGAAAEWDQSSEAPSYVQTTFLPTHVVPDIAFDVPGDQSVLRLALLSGIESSQDRILAGLDSFLDGYEDWIERTRAGVAEFVPPESREAANRLIDRAQSATTRMRSGIRLLASSTQARRAFALANQAMLMQMVHSGPEFAGTPRSVSLAPADVEPDYSSVHAAWRPFQLGFLLLTLVSVTEEDNPERDLVDLIWFPTGGGKTEAYLGLAAYTIFLRRIRHGDDGAGTTVVTRYTLRLLTTQQFQRASTMILACEKLRRESPDELGSRPVSIGIWVGGTNTPNKYADARQLLTKLQKGAEAEKGFQVEACPWCGARVVPQPGDPDQGWGISATNNSFSVRCLNRHCPFHDVIPLSSVDADLYKNPPTMLVGTVDKFARAVWEPRTGVFFGSGSDPGPSLLIQDEFHLISGPLGTVVGLYEAALDVLMARNGTRPKIVAATATIRGAREQVAGVFGRDVSLFPPSGLEADDSYFVRIRTDTPGRAYVGVMPQGHTPLTALVHLLAAQLQAPVDLDLSSNVEDGYRTVVAYHNSLRELGKTITLAHDDIPARIDIISRSQSNSRDLDDETIVELTSNISAVRIPRILERLSRPAGDPGSVSFLASTNMISVGVDVSRLGMMTVVGQPKTTAEYIQATSRVGRDASRPGLVVTLYSPSKPRDRSHYESFVPYHSMLYRAVEPTSVTPFSVPARARALHADLVLLVRHCLGLADEKDAALFDPEDSALRTVMEDFLARVERADPEESDRVRDHIGHLTREWYAKVRQAEAHGGLRYSGTGKGQPRLLRRFTDKGEGWQTLDSMRSVDVDVKVRVSGVRR
ncbi:helicase-related protein [Nocardiopsis sp. NPDC006198]|uniref:helicase-related protein n=1 Tax=Nocardiopsis sp. NPDC006198 TaxID=3154472 RepID=UPI0033AD766F